MRSGYLPTPSDALVFVEERSDSLALLAKVGKRTTRYETVI
jgi:hypothetical protein